MVPDLRPSSPLSTGPTLFLASSPTEWHGRHFLNEFSPAARSCAEAQALDATITMPAMAQLFIYGSFGTGGADARQSIGYVGRVRMTLRACPVNIPIRATDSRSRLDRSEER